MGALPMILAVTLLLTAGAPPVGAATDHFECYRVKRARGTPPFFPVPGVDVVDSFGQSTVEVRRPRTLCTPLDKNGEDPTAPSHLDHLVGYQMRAPRVQPVLGQTVVNQFGTIVVDVQRRESLLVPARKSLVSAPAPPPPNPDVDHFQCYTTRLAAGSPPFTVVPNVVLTDQFGSATVDVRRPTRLCAPVDKNGEELGAENHLDHLMCYRVRFRTRPPLPLGAIFTNDQFGPRTLVRPRPYEICVPSLKSPPPCCGPERVTMTTGAGTLRFGDFQWQIPAGGTIAFDSGAAVAPYPECKHAVTVPPGGFQLATFDLPQFGWCGRFSAMGCESGTEDGAGFAWDGVGAPGFAVNDVEKIGDTSDGICNIPSGQVCGTGLGEAGANTLGDVETTFTPSSSSGLRTQLDVRANLFIWFDTACDPSVTPGCCASATYDPIAGDDDILLYMVLGLTTDAATGRFGPLDGDGCERAGMGFGGASPDGPVTVTGAPPAGPCCTVGQPMTMVAAGELFTGWFVFHDTGFHLTLPGVVTACGSAGGGACTVTTDQCLY